MKKYIGTGGIIISVIIVLYIMIKIPKTRKKKQETSHIDMNNLSQINFESLADLQYNAMLDIGTDEETLFNSLNGLTDNDLEYLHVVFGERGTIPGFKYSLSEWYRAELNRNELRRTKRNWENTTIRI